MRKGEQTKRKHEARKSKKRSIKDHSLPASNARTKETSE